MLTWRSVGKASSAVACLGKRAWDKTMTAAKTQDGYIYETCVPYSVHSCTERSLDPVSRQEHRLNSSHMSSLRRSQGISWQDRVPSKIDLTQAGSPCSPTDDLDGRGMSVHIQNTQATISVIHF